jgi:hypothetical protein
MGIGESKREKTANVNLENIFNWSLPEGKKQETVGQATTTGALSDLDKAKAYWQKLLTAGRTETAAQAAPAVNAAQAQADAQKREAAATGTARGGGTAGISREAGETTTKSIDDLINQNLMGGRTTGAAGVERVAGGEADIGKTQLSVALQLLGLGGEVSGKELSGAEQKLSTQTEAWSKIFSALI